MKILVPIFLLLSSTFNLYAGENLLECKYSISHWFGTAKGDFRPVDQDDNLPDETLNIDTDKQTVTIGSSKYDYVLHNDKIWFDFAGAHSMKTEISVNTINGDMIVFSHAKVGNPSYYEYVDSDGTAVTHKFFYRCSKIERLIN